MNFEKLSKEISYALRHHPEEYGLELDQEGWTLIDALIEELRKRGFSNLTYQDIENMIQLSPKKRHEIKGDRIRAYYGHSNTINIIKEKTIPPEKLYHGTTLDGYKMIMKTSLKGMKRKYVHLSDNIETAIFNAKRKTNNPIILEINSKLANTKGIHFYKEENSVWLSEEIPSEFIILIKW